MCSSYPHGPVDCLSRKETSSMLQSGSEQKQHADRVDL